MFNYNNQLDQLYNCTVETSFNQLLSTDIFKCEINETLTRCGAPNNLKTDPNWVAKGVVHANE